MAGENCGEALGQRVINRVDAELFDRTIEHVLRRDAAPRTLAFFGGADDDGVYGVALNLQVPPGSSDAAYVGAFPTAAVAWEAQQHVTLTLNYVAYIFGDFVTESLPDQDNRSYLSMIATFRF